MLQIKCNSYGLVYSSVFSLFGIQSQAFAQTTNQSVKECLEQPENCGEEQGTEVIDEQTDASN